MTQPAVVARWRSSNRDDFEKTIETSKVIRVPGAKRQSGSAGGSGDQEVERTRPSGFLPYLHDRGVDASVGPRRLIVERQRIEGRVCPLKPVLATPPLSWVLGRVGASGEVTYRQRRLLGEPAHGLQDLSADLESPWADQASGWDDGG